MMLIGSGAVFLTRLTIGVMIYLILLIYRNKKPFYLLPGGCPWPWSGPQSSQAVAV
jgi:hypothetical protein